MAEVEGRMLWWKSGVIYQVYPRSFMDSDGDGVGDLKGITQKLEYLSDLGIDALWISPIFPSPMADFGYDVSDYTDIHPMFGSLSDFDALVEKAHSLGVKVILDYVPNHTSDEHEWFVESRASRENPKRNWYVWRDAKPDGGLPNNWESYFGGSAWEWDNATGQFYLHLFDRKQPDLNWRNPEVRGAMYDALRFWFERGVDGFRIDVLWLLIKDEGFRDNPDNPDWKQGDLIGDRQERRYSEDQPGMAEIVRELRSVADEYDERVLIGEIYLPFERLMAYYGDPSDSVEVELDGIQLPFNFSLVTLPEWNAKSVRELVDSYEESLPEGAWPNWVLGNHDQPRVASRIGSDAARLATMLLLTLRGTPTLYYGDEIGMLDVPVPPEMAHDPQGKVHEGYGRDPQRTPMQWDDTENAGFTTGEPWLPIAEDFRSCNVAAGSSGRPDSVLAFNRALIELRRSSTEISTGDYRSVDFGNEYLFAYTRELNGEQVLVLLNFSDVELEIPDVPGGEFLISTHLDREGAAEAGTLTLRANEGVAISLDQSISEA